MSYSALRLTIYCRQVHMQYLKINHFLQINANREKSGNIINAYTSLVPNNCLLPLEPQHYSTI
jgi:hypothetical protein